MYICFGILRYYNFKVKIMQNPMNIFKSIFTKRKCSVIGMIHLLALPGCPRYAGSIQKIINKALHELDIYMKCGIDGILVENMNDIPYLKGNELKPEITATMSRVCTEIKGRVGNEVPCGVQILAGGNKEALAVAQACDFNFIRTEGFVFSHIADEGLIEGCAGPLLRYRRGINADNILVFTDIKKKHSSHAITADVDIVETAKAAEFFLSNGIILTGSSTGEATDENELRAVKKNISIPVLIGSGVTVDNVQKYLEADGLIVGSSFKRDGYWAKDLDEKNVQKFMDTMKLYFK